MRIYWPVFLLCHLYKLRKQISIISTIEAFIPPKAPFYAGKVKDHMEDGFEKAIEAVFKGTPVTEILYATAGIVPKIRHGKAMSRCMADFVLAPYEHNVLRLGLE